MSKAELVLLVFAQRDSLIRSEVLERLDSVEGVFEIEHVMWLVSISGQDIIKRLNALL